MTKREREIRRACPYLENMGNRGYMCNRNSFWTTTEPKELAMTEPYRNRKECLGCDDMYRLTNTQPLTAISTTK